MPNRLMPLIKFYKIQKHVIWVNPTSTRFGRENIVEKNIGKKNMIVLQDNSLKSLSQVPAYLN